MGTRYSFLGNIDTYQMCVLLFCQGLHAPKCVARLAESGDEFQLGLKVRPTETSIYYNMAAIPVEI